MLVDPDIVRTFSFPKDVPELVQQLSRNALVYYDNLSRIPGWISDVLCRATTRSGFSKRQLYTNDEDVVYSFMRAIGFNGINLAATKADLLDRGLIIQTEMIPRKDRRRMRVIWNKFNSIRPQLLSYIFDVLVEVLRWKRENPSTELLKELPRMADWAEWCEIISRCMGEKNDAFINAYNENISLQVEEIVESSDLAIVIRQLVNENERTFEGTATELLTKLNILADANNIDRNNRYYPKTALKLSYGLRLLQKTLRDIGINIDWYKDVSTINNTRKIKIEFLSSEPSVRWGEIKHEMSSFHGVLSDDYRTILQDLSSDEKPKIKRENGLSVEGN